MLSILKNWYQNASSHCDSLELDQALARLAIGTLLTFYLLISFFYKKDIGQNEIFNFSFVLIFEILALILLAAISKANTKSRNRRLIGNWLDVVGTTIFLSLAGDISVAFIGAYLWITFSNGFKYGNKYLYHSQAISLLGFFIVTLINPFWAKQPAIIASFILMLTVLPMYVAQHIKRLNEAKLKTNVSMARAEEENPTKSRFTADMSNEANAPIDGIIDINTQLQKTPLNTLKKHNSATETLLPSLNILVCEDEASNQKVITRLLKLAGHNVTLVENSDEMLDHLETTRFDLVITDLNMSGISGIDALKLYRFMQPADSLTRFILFTADTRAETSKDAANAGFDSILTKPVAPSALFNVIEETLNLPQSTASHWLHDIQSTNHTEVISDLAKGDITLDSNTLLALEKVGAGDDLFMHRLLKNYLADSLKIITKISDAHQQKHYIELQNHCYALKGNSLSIGALQLANTADSVSQLNSSTPTAKSKEVLRQLHSDFSQLTLAIEGYLRKPKAASK